MLSFVSCSLFLWHMSSIANQKHHHCLYFLLVLTFFMESHLQHLVIFSLSECWEQFLNLCLTMYDLSLTPPSFYFHYFHINQKTIVLFIYLLMVLDGFCQLADELSQWKILSSWNLARVLRRQTCQKREFQSEEWEWPWMLIVTNVSKLLPVDGHCVLLWSSEEGKIVAKCIRVQATDSLSFWSLTEHSFKLTPPSTLFSGQARVRFILQTH